MAGFEVIIYGRFWVIAEGVAVATAYVAGDRNICQSFLSHRNWLFLTVHHDIFLTGVHQLGAILLLPSGRLSVVWPSRLKR
jgi:hypothetical protein